MSFTDLPDLASKRVGGQVLAANDEFFSPKDNLIKANEPVWLADEYTDRGKWMDGWETRRRREPGHDWVIVRLGLAGAVHGVVVDTTHFRGNYPESCSIDVCDACDLGPDADLERVLATTKWREVLPQSMLDGNAKNEFPIADPGRVTHLRLNIHPDGGVARLRVHGTVAPDWDALDSAGDPLDLAAIALGGRAVTCSDECFGMADNLLMPGPARNIGEGWQTRRRREPGHDWMIVQLGTPGVIESAVIDTSHFIGNAPEAASLHWCDATEAMAQTSGESQLIEHLLSEECAWRPLLDRTELQPNREQVFADELQTMETATHVRFSIHPDGGVARLRLFGQSERARAWQAGLRSLNSAAPDRFEADLLACCGARAWVAGMSAARPFADVEELVATADRVWDGLGRDDWLEAFAAHPRIGERKDGDGKFARWSRGEQAGVAATEQDILDELAARNHEYYERNGFIFIVFASGKSAAQMLDILRARLGNDRDTEIVNAAAAQAKITRVRLHKLLRG